MLHKCQLISCSSSAAWESSTAIPPLPILVGKAEAGEVEPQGCCYVPAASADGISGDGRQDPAVANGSYALGAPRRWVGVCKSLGLRILHKKNPGAKKRIESSSPRSCSAACAGERAELLTCWSHSLLQHQVLFVFSSSPWRKWRGAHANNSGVYTNYGSRDVSCKEMSIWV